MNLFRKNRITVRNRRIIDTLEMVRYLHSLQHELLGLLESMALGLKFITELSQVHNTTVRVLRHQPVLLKELLSSLLEFCHLGLIFANLLDLFRELILQVLDHGQGVL